MGTHKLLDWDIEEEPYTLIGLHSTVEPYRMAFLINKYLKVSFQRLERDQDIMLPDHIAKFPVYYYKDKNQNVGLFLVPNHCKAQVKSTSSAGSLFALNQVDEIKTTLIKEYRTVDYFLKIEKDRTQYPVRKTITAINEIPQVLSVYETDHRQIRNTDYLIFE